MKDIRRLALRLQEIGRKIRSAALRESVVDRGIALEKPDSRLQHALQDLDRAAGALEFVKVYAATYPLDWHEQELWTRSAEYREHVKRKLAANIAAGLRDDALQVDLVETDRPQIKAVMAQVALITSGPQAFTDDLQAAFQAGAEAMRASIAAAVDKEFRGEHQRAALAYLMTMVRAHRVQAPEHMR